MSSNGNVSEQVVKDDDEIEIKIEVPDVPDSEYLYDNNAKRVQQEDSHDTSLSVWTSQAESCLIKLYKKYKPMVGQTTRFKSIRDMFDTIAEEIQKNGFAFSSQKCENKWRVLKRKYEVLATREKMKKPGRIKHYGKWEHKKIFDEIYNEEQKHVYLDKNETTEKLADTPEVDNNTLLSSSENGHQISTLVSDSASPKLDIIVSELRRISEQTERNKERRHLEKMAVLKKQLEIQERLLKIKEQKLKLKRASIGAMARNLD